MTDVTARTTVLSGGKMNVEKKANRLVRCCLCKWHGYAEPRKDTCPRCRKWSLIPQAVIKPKHREVKAMTYPDSREPFLGDPDG